MLVKLDHFPRDEHKKYLKPPTRELVDNIQDEIGTLTQSNAYDFLHGITSNYMKPPASKRTFNPDTKNASLNQGFLMEGLHLSEVN